MKRREHFTVLMGLRAEEMEKYPLERWLDGYPASLFTCTDGIGTLRHALVKRPDIILMDATLPKLNGYQCAKLLKSDPHARRIPIVLTGPSDNPLSHYWTRVCRAEQYLPQPLSADTVVQTILSIVEKTDRSQRVLAPDSIIPELDDTAILTMANNLLEKDYLRSHILNEINLIDSHALELTELTAGIFRILHSLFDFKVGAALLIEDTSGEFLIHPFVSVSQRLADNIRSLLIAHIRGKHDFFLDPRRVRTVFLQQPETDGQHADPGHLFIHASDQGSIRSVLAFDGLAVDPLETAEHEILDTALRLAHQVIDRKIYYQLYRKLSLIDSSAEGYSLSFFMTVLLREMENGKRNGYPVTMFTFIVDESQGPLGPIPAHTRQGLHRILYQLILKVMRKSDIVAKWDSLAFAFLLTHTTLDKARLARNRIVGTIQNHMKKYPSQLGRLSLKTGVAQYDPETDQAPEIFFSRAKPVSPSGNATDSAGVPLS